MFLVGLSLGAARVEVVGPSAEVITTWCSNVPTPNSSLPWMLTPSEAAALSLRWGCDGPDSLARALVPWALAKHPLCGSSSCYTPLSNFSCYAVLTGSSGAVYFGVNFEVPGVASATTLHAEQFASIVSTGVGRARGGAHAETGLVSLAQRGTGAPCGHCRQWLAEFVDAPDLMLLGTSGARAPMSTLNPDAFGPAALNNTCPLLSPDPSCVERRAGAAAAGEPDSGNPLDDAALSEAARSYAPYTKRRSAVALLAADGRIWAAGVYESVAFNPTIQPIVAALTSLIAGGGAAGGRDWAAHVVEAVLAEETVDEPAPSFAAHTAAVMKSLAPEAAFRVIAFR